MNEDVVFFRRQVRWVRLTPSSPAPLKSHRGTHPNGKAARCDWSKHNTTYCPWWDAHNLWYCGSFPVQPGHNAPHYNNRRWNKKIGHTLLAIVAALFYQPRRGRVQVQQLPTLSTMAPVRMTKMMERRSGRDVSSKPSKDLPTCGISPFFVTLPPLGYIRWGRSFIFFFSIWTPQTLQPLNFLKLSYTPICMPTINIEPFEGMTVWTNIDPESSDYKFTDWK